MAASIVMLTWKSGAFVRGPCSEKLGLQVEHLWRNDSFYGQTQHLKSVWDLQN